MYQNNCFDIKTVIKKISMLCINFIFLLGGKRNSGFLNILTLKQLAIMQSWCVVLKGEITYQKAFFIIEIASMC